jgi:hypothetical protein
MQIGIESFYLQLNISECQITIPTALRNVTLLQDMWFVGGQPITAHSLEVESPKAEFLDQAG